MDNWVKAFKSLNDAPTKIGYRIDRKRFIKALQYLSDNHCEIFFNPENRKTIMIRDSKQWLPIQTLN